MASVKSLVRHLRRGTLFGRLIRGRGWLPAHVRVHWHGARDQAEGAAALAHWASLFVAARPGAGWVLSLGEDDAFHRLLNQHLQTRGVAYRAHALVEALRWQASDTAGLRGIVCGYADVARQTQAARALPQHPALSSVPFEYAAGINPERELFARRDEYAHTHFVAPSLLDRPSPYELYEESLTRFPQKCGLRDYLDLYQVIRHVVANRIAGDLAEFGSYQGHSGYLIARTLQALGSDKRLHMFDMFEQFPQEPYGMDHFWSATHTVDFGQVQAKLADLPNVRLVRGDFTQTLATSGVGQLALAYVDCDSYRATRYLIRTLWDRHLMRGAALVCEDYGHPALLGNRAAVHEELDGSAGAFRFFSQFSGLYIALKLAE